MPVVAWYIHMDGAVVGPLPTEKVSAMLSQNRLQFADFAWTEGFTKWVRVSEIDAFASLLPAYPQVPIPTAPSSKAVTEPSPEAPKARPVQETLEASAPQAPQRPAHAPAQPKAAPTPEKERPLARYLRIPFQGEIDAGEKGKFTILNIAERGVFVAAKAPLPVGTELNILLTSKHFPEPLQLKGMIVRHSSDKEEPGFAIEFIRLNPVHKRLIEQYVRKKIESLEQS